MNYKIWIVLEIADKVAGSLFKFGSSQRDTEDIALNTHFMLKAVSPGLPEGLLPLLKEYYALQRMLFYAEEAVSVSCLSSDEKDYGLEETLAQLRASLNGRINNCRKKMRREIIDDKDKEQA